MSFALSHSLPDWHVQAACEGLPIEWFFGKDELPGNQRHRPSLSLREVQRAKSVCFACPVMEQYLKWALANHEEFGVWGATTGRERAKWWRENEAYDTGQAC